MTTQTQSTDFDSFERDDWIEFAWDSLDFSVLTIDQQRDLGLDEVPCTHRREAEDKIVRHKPVIADERFKDVDQPQLHSYEDLETVDTLSLIAISYSFKASVETSPHPENTMMRQLGLHLRELHNRGFDMSGFADGSLVEEAEARGLFD